MNSCKFEEVNEFIDNMKQIKKNLKISKKLIKDFKTNKDQSKEQNLKKLIDEYLNYTHQMVNGMKTDLEQFRNEILKKRKELKDVYLEDTMLRFYDTICRVFRVQTVEYTKDLFRLKVELKNLFREKIKRKLMVYDPKIDDKKLEELFEEPEKIEAIIQEKMYGEVSMKIDNAIVDIREQLNDIKKVEKGVFSLCSIMDNFYDILKSQTDIINSIENNMYQIRNHVEKSSKFVKDSNEIYSGTQDKLCCLFFIFLLLSIIVINSLLGGLTD